MGQSVHYPSLEPPLPNPHHASFLNVSGLSLNATSSRKPSLIPPHPQVKIGLCVSTLCAFFFMIPQILIIMCDYLLNIFSTTESINPLWTGTVSSLIHHRRWPRHHSAQCLWYNSHPTTCHTQLVKYMNKWMKNSPTQWWRLNPVHLPNFLDELASKEFSKEISGDYQWHCVKYWDLEKKGDNPF